MKIWEEIHKTRRTETQMTALCLVTQLCLTLCNPKDCSLPGSSLHGILQARILEWVTMPSTRGSSQAMYRTQVSPIAGRFFTVWATYHSGLIRYTVLKGKKKSTTKNPSVFISKNRDEVTLWRMKNCEEYYSIKSCLLIFIYAIPSTVCNKCEGR